MADSLAPSSRHQYVHQGRVVYEWDQAFSEVNIYVQVPPGVRAKQLYCDIGLNSLNFGVSPNPPYLAGELSGSVKVSESFWTLEDGSLHITLQKLQQGEPWPSALRGHEADPLTQQRDTERLMLERFQQEHPGFDFSGASFNGSVPNPRTFMGGASIP
ncbi:CS-domain-containing protein [Haematococcus lacustris]